LLGDDAALAMPETGRVLGGGFAVPRIRGQDARLTELWLGRLKLIEPHTGLPLVDDLDLRPFRELAAQLGATPPALPSVSPTGALELRFRPVTRRETSVGAVAGRPFGAMGWSFAKGRAATKEASTTWRLYVRRHTTDGRYSYYDDNATPYNT